ncbi:MAG TPA: agmatine deiminase family protein [Rhizomicrobium sp.]|nr:agmatine deiminase family protein [Rhizomicrobium sp.]
MSEGLDRENSSPARDGFAMPAEWDAHLRTWMCWPCRTEAWGGPEAMLRAKQAYARVARAISTFEPVVMAVRPHDYAEAKLACAGRVEFFEAPLDDSWSRDMGPTFLLGAGGARAGVQWQFNAWGNKYRPYDSDAEFATRVLRHQDVPVYYAPFICEGGAIHVDGEGTLIATEQCLLNPNRNPGLTQQQVEQGVALFTGARKVIWLGDGFSDEETDGHVDNIACFVAPGRVLIGVPPRAHPDYGPVMEAIRRLKDTRDAQGRALEIIEMAQPQKLAGDWRGRPLAASYINFYLPTGGVVMPAFDDPNDEAARGVLADCFPGRDILQIDAVDIVQGGGGIHCITQQEPAS